MVNKPSGRYKRRDQENELAEQPRDSEQASEVAARDQVAPPEKPTLVDDPVNLDDIVAAPDLPAPNDLRVPAGSEELGIEGHFDLDQEVWDGDHKLPDGGGLLTGQELVDQAMANDAPPEKNLDGATEGWFGDSISGKTKETGAGLATGTARSKFSIVDLPGMGEAGAEIPHGEALAASDADGVDGPQGRKTPAEGGLAGFTEKQINVLADAVQEAKENTPVGKTVKLKYEGAIVTVKGEKEVDGEGG